MTVLCIATALCAYDIHYDDLYYNITSESDHTVEVAELYLCSASFNIPASVTYQGIVYRVTRIGAYAFSGCNTNLTDVTIPNSVISIGEAAFSGTGLVSVTIPNSVDSIGDYAFWNCMSLASVTIGNSVMYIGDGAFWGCTSLTSIAIPNSITSIGRNVFNGCTGLTSVTIGDNVTSIGDAAFSGTGLSSVTIPNSVTYIDSYAFSGCTALTSITMGNSVRTFGGAVFSGCTSLTSIIIPSSVDSVTYNTFSGCTSLTSVTLGDGVTSIGSAAFSGCTNLTSVSIPNSVECIGFGAFADCIGLTSVTIGNSVTSIYGEAFSGCTGLTSVTIPNSVTYLDSRAFWGCTGLTSVTIGNGVTGIGTMAFSGFTNLTSVTIGNSVKYIGEAAFQGCTGLTSITLPNSVDSIALHAFSGCTGLTSVSLGNSVTTICFEAFSNCTGLASITIPSSVKSIEDDAFSGRELKKVNYEGGIKGGLGIDFHSQGNPIRCSRNLYINDILLTDLVILDDVTMVSEAFAYDTCLTSVVIGNSVTDINGRAFKGCTGLTSVAVKTGNTKYDSRDNCNAIIETATNTLVQGFNITTIPNGVTSIGEEAFFDCTGLTAITIPNSVTSLEFGAFSDCEDLTSVTILDGVMSIGEGTFWGTGLTSVTIPNSVTSIGEAAFYDCESLTSVVIGNNDELKIGSNAFAGCESLTNVTCYANVPPTIIIYDGYGAFDANRLSEITLYVPAKAVNDYKEAEGWKDFAHIVPIGATPVETDEPVIAPSYTDVTITWPATAGAETYTIIVTKDGETVCTLTFDSTGQLTNIAFAMPAFDGTTRHAPAALRTQSGFRFTITGLESDTQYGYSIVTKDRDEQPLSTYDGTFCTTNRIPTATDGVSPDGSSDNATAHTGKVFRNGQVLILHTGKTYTLSGTEIE